LRFALSAAVLLTAALVSVPSWAFPPDGIAATKQAEREKAFIDLLTGAELVGSFTVDGKEQTGPPKVDRYSVVKVEKQMLEGQPIWLIYAKMGKGEKALTVPVPVNMNWAEDTPVLSLTNLDIPGVGSDFGTRLLFYDNLYAGTWSHGRVTGHMWGRIERAAPVKK